MDVPSFDPQASRYDERAGVGEAVGRRVAERVAAIAGPGRLLELGCGTGEIGATLVGLVDYVGVDVSQGMLDVFRKRCPSAALVHADSGEKWPFPDGSVAAVFGSRSLHLMDPTHLAEECRRVASAEGLRLIVGRVNRDPEALQARLRRRMQRLLRARGYEPRDGGRNKRNLFERLGVNPEEETVATWPVSHTVRAALAAWADKPGLAGTHVTDADKEAVLATLAEEAGDLDLPHESEESYVLTTGTIGRPS